MQSISKCSMQIYCVLQQSSRVIHTETLNRQKNERYIARDKPRQLICLGACVLNCCFVSTPKLFIFFFIFIQNILILTRLLSPVLPSDADRSYYCIGALLFHLCLAALEEIGLFRLLFFFASNRPIYRIQQISHSRQFPYLLMHLHRRMLPLCIRNNQENH